MRLWARMAVGVVRGRGKRGMRRVGAGGALWRRGKGNGEGEWGKGKRKAGNGEWVLERNPARLDIFDLGMLVIQILLWLGDVLICVIASHVYLIWLGCVCSGLCFLYRATVIFVLACVCFPFLIMFGGDDDDVNMFFGCCYVVWLMFAICFLACCLLYRSTVIFIFLAWLCCLFSGLAVFVEQGNSYL